MTQDIGTAKQRFDDYPIDKMIYVVGNEQNYHFQVLAIILDRLGFKWGKDLVHFSYGMVELPEGKMKSREGTVVDADDLMAEMVASAKEVATQLGKTDGMTEAEIDNIAETVGMGALKYFLLKVDPRKNMTFNPKESIDFNGNTGPFIQYTYARIRSVLRKAAEAGLQAVDYSNVEPNEREIALIQRLGDFPGVVARGRSQLFARAHCQLCLRPYQGVQSVLPRLFDSERYPRGMLAARMALSGATARTIKAALGLLGINVVERM